MRDVVKDTEKRKTEGGGGERKCSERKEQGVLKK